MACYILGISAFHHKSGCALLKDGEILAAVQEERFSRIKNDANFPTQSVQHCLQHANLRLRDIHYIAYDTRPHKNLEIALETHLTQPLLGIKSFQRAISRSIFETSRLRAKLKASLVKLSKKKQDPLPTILLTDTLDAYAALAFYPCPYKHAAVLCMSDNPTLNSMAAFVGNETHLSPLWQQRFPHSLSFLYAAFTEFLGFDPHHEKSHVMDLAAYGRPSFSALIQEKLVTIKADGTIQLNSKYFNFLNTKNLTNSSFANLFDGAPRSAATPLTRTEMDIACSIQAVTEEVLIRLASTLSEETGLNRLCIAGSMAFNSVAHNKILQRTPILDLWAPSNTDSSSGALGAALHTWHQVLGHLRIQEPLPSLQEGALGPNYSKLIEAMVLRQHSTTRRYASQSALVHAVAKQLANDHIVGWYQGRLEYSDSSLGNRSILASPLSLDCATTVKARILKPESFKALTALVKEDRVHEWFDIAVGRKSTFGQLTAKIHPHKIENLDPQILIQRGQSLGLRASTIPGVTQVDFTAHIQTINKTSQPLLYSLLDAFDILTGCPILMSADFCEPSKPIVCTPQEAYDCYQALELDDLILESFHFNTAEKKLNLLSEVEVEGEIS